MNACQVVLEHKEIAGLSLTIGILILEAWMGKTDKVRAASILEAIFNVVVKPQPKSFDFPTPPKKEESEDGKSI